MIDFRRSAGTRIAAASAAVFLVASSTIGLAAIALVQAYMRTSLDRQIERAASGVVGEHERAPAAIANAVRQREAHSGAPLGYVLFDPAGRRIAGKLDAPLLAPGWHDTSIRDEVDGADPARALVLSLRGGERLMVAGDRRPLETMKRGVLALYLLAVIVSALLCAALAVVLARYLDRRLTPIMRVASAVTQGRRAERIPVAMVRDEFDVAATSLNLMLDHHDALLEQLRQVTGDVAHDLRTPLTRARAELENALGGASSHDRAITRSLEHLDGAIGLFAAILRVAEVEGGERLRAEPVAMEALVGDICATYAPVFEDAGGRLDRRAAADCLVSGDRDLLAAVLINLLENVLRHAGAGASARIEVAHHAGAVRLTVRDDGRGVPAAELDRIFERFVRLDATRGSDGFGLGLSLVRAIAQAHGGRVSAMAGDPGLAIVLDLPSFARDAR